ncbi:MAG TPA: sulfate reduction electron transfer complex DsrMKJOP subunit DsrJ [Syntrophomonadaceae bacterium]|nr:sulfate reduction electron transfer complex DsrMKJOP subunit DsrJ [Syntrophomonadaceae bacterium]HPR94183.1 sulfate reduction electron transfer complex DsrMKJOP subunit DsrJ [Syntrophomonadaceae bacterium]
MYNSKKIITGIIIFIFIIIAPFLLNIGKADVLPELSLDTPAIDQMADKHCVEAAEFMRAEHPRLLDDWRDQAVREGNTIYISTSGEEYEMSLENSCIKCHSNREQFCDACHTYTAVQPYCWDCHDAAKGAGTAK